MSTAASQPRSEAPRLVVVMGVAGCGKSTVAAALADGCGGTLLEGDSFHPASNIAKMTSGTPLTDEDRWPWLDAMGRAMGQTSGRVFAACSALRRVYRERLTAAAGEPVFFLHLDGSKHLIAGRMHARSGHFMPESLLDSQFATLEPLEPDEFAARIPIDQPVEHVLAASRKAIG
ncbi:gluconokinase [Halovulum sp. GXIMD14794]